MLDINITHPIRVTQLAISHFLEEKKPGSVVHLSSVAGQHSFSPTPLYNTSKHAISGFVRTLAPLEQRLGIRVTAIAPGLIKTPIWTDVRVFPSLVLVVILDLLTVLLIIVSRKAQEFQGGRW